MDCSLLGSSVHRISQARILEWVAISFPRGSSWPKDQTSISWLGRQILYSWTTRYLKHVLWIVFFFRYQILLQPLSKTEELWSLLITHSYSCTHTHTHTHTHKQYTHIDNFLTSWYLCSLNHWMISELCNLTRSGAILQFIRNFLSFSLEWYEVKWWESLSHVQLWDSIGYSPPDFCVHRILQARILEWVAIPFFRRSSRTRDRTHVSCVSCIGGQVLYH